MRIVITGARQGLGRDAAFTLANLGHEVIATTRTEIEAKELAKEARQKNIQLKTNKADILEDKDRHMIAYLKPDVLINNAAIGESGPLAEIPIGHVRENFETNVFATLELTQLVAKDMIEASSGRIIIFSSVAGRITLPYLGPYSMTKYALESMGDALRNELAHHNISVSLVEPGAIATGFNERMNASKYKWFNRASLFWDDVERVKKYEQALTRNQASVHSVTRAVVHAATSEYPKARYTRPYTSALTARVADFAPNWLKDKILQRIGDR